MPDRVYVDSCIILGYLKEEEGRVDVIETLLYEISTGKSQVKVFTSTMSLVEIAYLETEGKLSEEDFCRIDQFWANAPIELIEISEVSAIEGRRLIRDRALGNGGPQLPQVRKRAADLCHLGAARTLGVDEFWTYDDEIKKYNSSLTICEPHAQQQSFFGKL